ncbi:MAG: 3'-5' exonuclease [Bdellovibrionales bacterium]|nr:3'-5' exonuclease [Bdellovibrionales bacterium]
MRFVAFDLETTGTLPGVDRIVEIGAVRFVNGTVDALFSTLVDPLVPIPPEASRVNKIFDEMVKGKPTIETLLGPFAEFCGDDILVAHNAIFDAQFLTADIKKYESPAPRGPVVDTYGMAKRILPGLANYRLGTLVQYLKIEATEFHRAEEDASYCGQLFIHLLKKISNSSFEMLPIENLINLTGRAELRFPQIIPQPKQLDLLDGLF